MTTNEKGLLTTPAGVPFFQRCMVEYPENSWEQLNSEFHVRFGEVNDPHHTLILLCQARKVTHESLQVYSEAVCFGK